MTEMWGFDLLLPSDGFTGKTWALRKNPRRGAEEANPEDKSLLLHGAAGSRFLSFCVLVCNNKRKTCDFEGRRVLLPPPATPRLCCITCDVFSR